MRLPIRSLPFAIPSDPGPRSNAEFQSRRVNLESMPIVDGKRGGQIWKCCENIAGNSWDDGETRFQGRKKCPAALSASVRR